MQAAPLITDPAGDSYIKIQVEVDIQFFGAAGETVYYGSVKLLSVSLQYLNKSLVRISLMHKQRFFQFTGHLDLCFKTLLLQIAGRKISIEIETAFANSNYLRMC